MRFFGIFEIKFIWREAKCSCGSRTIQGKDFCLGCFGKYCRDRGREEGYRDGFLDGKREGTIVRSNIDIPQDLLKNLVFLCHPDKHGGSELSTKVTQWLLDKRKKK